MTQAVDANIVLASIIDVGWGKSTSNSVSKLQFTSWALLYGMVEPVLMKGERLSILHTNVMVVVYFGLQFVFCA